jgi:phytoene desaturase
MLYLGVEGPIDLPHHTIYVSENYDENLADIASGNATTEDPSFYVCNPSRTDPTLAPENHAALYVLLPTANLNAKDDWHSDRQRVRDTIFQQLERRTGLKDLRKRVRAEKFITPDDWAAMNINHGATFNLAHNLGQMLHKRPHHRLQGFDNLWLVGGGTHPGSGLPVIFLSSQITAKLLCEELNLTYAGTPHAQNTAQGAARSRELIETRGRGLTETGPTPVTGPAHASKATSPSRPLQSDQT